jgi:hypothetical protein
VDLNFYVYRNRNYNEVFLRDHLFFCVSKEDLYKYYIEDINETTDITIKSFDKAGSVLPEHYEEPKTQVTAPVV